MKTVKAISKRIDVRVRRRKGQKKVTIMRRKEGQNHLNSRESGKTGRHKRQDVHISPTLAKTILRALPNV